MVPKRFTSGDVTMENSKIKLTYLYYMGMIFMIIGMVLGVKGSNFVPVIILLLAVSFLAGITVGVIFNPLFKIK